MSASSASSTSTSTSTSTSDIPTSVFQNDAIFIKRAEIYQDFDYIRNAFEWNNIGAVKETKFINKKNETCKPYHGVIVIFERWYANHLVNQLLSEMAASPDGTTRFYFDHNKYWIICIHQFKLPECQESTIVDPSLCISEQNTELKKIVRSMSTRIHYMEARQERAERHAMDIERVLMQNHLVNMEMRFELEDSADEISRLKRKNEQLKREYAELRKEVALWIGEK